MGIENLKITLHLLFSVAELADQVINGQLGLSTIGKVLDALKQIPAMIKALPADFQEFADLSAEEKQELKTFIAADFDLKEDGIEEAVETALGLVVDFSDFLKLFKKTPA